MPATLELPVLPPILYRYRAISGERLAREIGSIKQNYLWCSEYHKLNDPMEGFYKPSARVSKNPQYKSGADAIYYKKQNIGICSLSDTFENELMWAHYAENSSGICVGYRPRALIQGLSDDSRLVRLGYGSEPPEIGIKDGYGEEAARKILSHKKANWAYEREWRVLGPIGRARYEGDCVAEIRLGARISGEAKEAILHAFRSTKIRISLMSVSGYTQHWTKIHPAPKNTLK